MTFYPISDADRVSKKSNIRQLVDVLQADIASKDDSDTDINTRKKYSVFTVGGGTTTEPGIVNSSLYQTVFDQDHTIQTSNEMLDITIGSHQDSSTVTGVLSTPSTDNSGKLLFQSGTLMMREKVSIYKQYAQTLLGNADSYFFTPFESTSTENTDDRIHDAVFLNFKRLFVRDGIEKEQFSIRIHSHLPAPVAPASTNIDSNIDAVNNSGTFKVYSDQGSSTRLNVSTISGQVGFIEDDATNKVGLIFYNKGIVVLDARKVFAIGDHVVGNISSTSDASGSVALALADNIDFIPGFWTKGSIDNVIDHIATTRFGRTNASAVGFINQTSINSMLYFCRVGPNDANFSTNPTYIDADGNLRCIQERGDDPFSYVTTIGLYDAAGELLAVAKTSRPIEKNPEVDLSISVRLDY